MKRALMLAGLAAAAGWLPRAAALPAPEAAAGRELTARFAGAVVGVELVARVELTIGDLPAPPRQVRLDANGTMVGPDGLTATSLIEIDPRPTAEAATRSLTLPGRRQVKIGPTAFSDVKLRLGDGTEVPARIVYEDPAIDLALVAPEPALPPQPGRVAFNLNDAAQPALLADYFVLSRAPASLQRVPEVHVATIEGIVGSPHPCYIPNGFVAGCPMLDDAGHLLGLCLSQMVNGHPQMSGGRPNGVVVPAAVLAEDVRKAQAADDDVPDDDP